MARVHFWEELVPTPVFFAKSVEEIERKELGGKNVEYGKWKSAQEYEPKGVRSRRGNAHILGDLWTSREIPRLPSVARDSHPCRMLSCQRADAPGRPEVVWVRD